MPKLLLGPPGCGKTTRQLEELDARLHAGIRPDRIAYVSFTKAAVREARDRATKFNFSDHQFHNWRTLHSMCFHQLGLSRRDIFGRPELRRLAEITGEPLRGHADHTVPTIGNTGDAYLAVEQLARHRMMPLRDTWQRYGGSMDWWRLVRFTKAYEALRQQTMQLDFTDLLERYIAEGQPLDVDAVFIDEAQDLTPLQWAVARKAFGHVKDVMIACDDDQTIFEWAGADVGALLRIRGEREVLGKSHRLPREVYLLAMRVVQRIRRRFAKPFAPADHSGSVEWLRYETDARLHDGKWLLLARTRHQLERLKDAARAQSVYFEVMGAPSIDPELVMRIRDHERLRRANPALPIWHIAFDDVALDHREYIRSCLRREEKLTEAPRIRIETIHSAKGKEEENVLLLTDITPRVKNGMMMDMDAEMRVLYVAVTRAMKNLFLVSPMRYDLAYQL